MKYGLTFLGGIVFTFVAVDKFGKQMSETLENLTEKIKQKREQS